MKFFKRFLCLTLVIATVAMALAACNGTQEPTDTTAPDTTTADTTTAPVTTVPVTTEPVTTEPVTTVPVTTEPPAELTLAQKLAVVTGKELSKTFVGDDFLGEGGYETHRYLQAEEEQYEAACKLFEDEGWTLYCEDAMTYTASKTYTKGNAYAVILFLARKAWLMVTISEGGAGNLPVQDTEYEKLYPVTITQPCTEPKQGLCEIFRLSDGSFLLFDGSNRGSQDAIWSHLVELNGGSAENIHIRAWVLTHTHGDHYGGFRDFAYSYASHVKLDYVLFAPTNRDIIKAIEDLPNNDWDTIDYSFNRGAVSGSDSLAMIWTALFEGAKLCVVHAGQKFHFGGADLRILYTSEHLYIDKIPVNVNNTSISALVTSEDGQAYIGGDSGTEATEWIIRVHYKDVASDIFQIPHHGMSTKTDVSLAQLVLADIILVPCTKNYYEKNARVHTETIRNMEQVKASHVMGEGTVTYKLDGTLLP